MSNAFIKKEQIRAVVGRVAREITAAGRPVCLAPILRGGLFFAVDLARQLSHVTRVEPILPTGLTPGGERMRQPGYDIWVVDDTISSGRTLSVVLGKLPPGTKSAVMFGLAGRRLVQPTVVGMELGPVMIAGYGGDMGGQMRGLEEVWPAGVEPW